MLLCHGLTACFEDNHINKVKIGQVFCMQEESAAAEDYANLAIAAEDNATLAIATEEPPAAEDVLPAAAPVLSFSEEQPREEDFAPVAEPLAFLKACTSCSAHCLCSSSITMNF